MNNREAATFILLGVFFIYILLNSKTRLSLADIAKQLLLSKLTCILASYIAVICAATFLAARLNLWTTALTAATALWFLFTGFAWFMDLNGAGKDADFFKRRFLETLGFAAFFEFFLNAQVLPLAAEIFGQVFLLVVVLLNVVASQDEQYKLVAKLTTGMLVVTSLGLLMYTAIKLTSDWENVDKASLANELLMPLWLTAAVIPYLYLVAFFMGYELLFVRLSFMNNRRSPRLRAKAGMLLGLRGSLVDVEAFNGPFARAAAQSESVRDALRQVRGFKHDRSIKDAARAQARQTLEQNAGRRGVDANGLVLDRREFAKTKDALRWLSTCHMGWYQRDDRPNEYRKDLLDVLMASDSKQFAFESKEPVISKVRKDGQAWYAYRVTPSGHVLGIGAGGPPPSQWFYDGPTSPSGFPSSKGAGWSDYMSPARPEWQVEPEV